MLEVLQKIKDGTAVLEFFERRVTIRSADILAKTFEMEIGQNRTLIKLANDQSFHIVHTQTPTETVDGCVIFSATLIGENIKYKIKIKIE